MKLGKPLRTVVVEPLLRSTKETAAKKTCTLPTTPRR